MKSWFWCLISPRIFQGSTFLFLSKFFYNVLPFLNEFVPHGFCWDFWGCCLKSFFFRGVGFSGDLLVFSFQRVVYGFVWRTSVFCSKNIHGDQRSSTSLETKAGWYFDSFCFQTLLGNTSIPVDGTYEWAARFKNGKGPHQDSEKHVWRNS